MGYCHQSVLSVKYGGLSVVDSLAGHDSGCHRDCVPTHRLGAFGPNSVIRLEVAGMTRRLRPGNQHWRSVGAQNRRPSFRGDGPAVATASSRVL